MNPSNVSILFLDYSHLKPCLSNAIFSRIQRILSPRFCTSAAQIDGIVYLWTPEALHLTTRQAIDDICQHVEEITIYPSPRQLQAYHNSLEQAIHQKGRWPIAKTFISGEYHSCSTLSSLLVDKRFLTPDSLYHYIKGDNNGVR